MIRRSAILLSVCCIVMKFIGSPRLVEDLLEDGKEDDEDDIDGSWHWLMVMEDSSHKGTDLTMVFLLMVLSVKAIWWCCHWCSCSWHLGVSSQGVICHWCYYTKHRSVRLLWPLDLKWATVLLSLMYYCEKKQPGVKVLSPTGVTIWSWAKTTWLYCDKQRPSLSNHGHDLLSNHRCLCFDYPIEIEPNPNRRICYPTLFLEKKTRPILQFPWKI